MADEAKTRTEEALENAGRRVDETVARRISEATEDPAGTARKMAGRLPNWAVNIGKPLITLVVAVLVLYGGIVWLFSRKSGEAIFRWLGELIEGSAVIGLTTFRQLKEWLLDPDNRLRQFLFKWGRLGEVFLVVLVTLTVVVTLVLFVSGVVAAYTGHPVMAGWLALLLAAIPWLISWVIQVIFGRGTEDESGEPEFGLKLSRVFAKLSHIIAFIGAMILLLPDSYRTSLFITGLVLVVFLGSSYLLIMGQRSTRLYRVMFVTAALMLVAKGVYLVLPGAQDATQEGQQYVSSLLRRGAAQIRQERFPAYTIREGGELVPIQGASSSSLKVETGDEVFVDKDDTLPVKTDNGKEHAYNFVRVMTIDGPKVIQEGYYALELMNPNKSPAPPEPVPVATAQATSPAPARSVRAGVIPIPRPRPRIPAPQLPLSLGADSVIVPVTFDWQDTGLIVNRHDLVVWKTLSGEPFSAEQDLERLQYLYATEETVDLEIPDHMDSPRPNGAGERWIGYSTTTVDSTIGSTLWVRVTQGQPQEVSIAVRRDAYHG